MFIALTDFFCLYVNIGQHCPPSMIITCLEQLGEELGCVFLPLLVVLAIAVPLVVFGFRHRDSAHFGDQESGEHWADVGQRQGSKDTARTSAESNGCLNGLAGEDTRRGGRDTSPEGRLAEVVGILAVKVNVSKPA